jgi:hypothetical protein
MRSVFWSIETPSLVEVAYYTPSLHLDILSIRFHLVLRLMLWQRLYCTISMIRYISVRQKMLILQELPDCCSLFLQRLGQDREKIELGSPPHVVASLEEGELEPLIPVEVC